LSSIYGSDFLSNKSTKEREKAKLIERVIVKLLEFHKFLIRFLSASIGIRFDGKKATGEHEYLIIIAFYQGHVGLILMRHTHLHEAKALPTRKKLFSFSSISVLQLSSFVRKNYVVFMNFLSGKTVYASVLVNGFDGRLEKQP
jgi:hypothetical protein